MTENTVKIDVDEKSLTDILAANAKVIRSLTADNFGAIPIDDFAVQIRLPKSTMEMLRTEGKGPKTFKLGRRVYVHVDDARDWLKSMAGENAATASNARTRGSANV